MNDIRYTDDEPDSTPEIAITRTARGFAIDLGALRRAMESGTPGVTFTAPEDYRFGADRRLHPDSTTARSYDIETGTSRGLSAIGRDVSRAVRVARAHGHVTFLTEDGQRVAEIIPARGEEPDPGPANVPPWHTGPEWSGWSASESTLNLAPVPWIGDSGVADAMLRALGGAIASAAARGQVTRLVNPAGDTVAAIVPAPDASGRSGAGQSGRELRRGTTDGHPLVTEAVRLAAEPTAVQDVVLVHRADLRGLLSWCGYNQACDGEDGNGGPLVGQLTRAAYADPVDDTAGLSAYSCRICGAIDQPEFWHDTSSHTGIPEGQCAHPQDQIDDEGTCRLCGEAVEGAALDAIVLNEIARLVAGGTSTTAAWQLFSEISSLVRWTGRNDGPGPDVWRSLRAGACEPASSGDVSQPDTLQEMRGEDR